MPESDSVAQADFPPHGVAMSRGESAALPAKDSRQGWGVVCAAFVGLLCSVGVLVVYSFGVLVSSMAQDFGWDPVQRSTLFVAFSLSGTVAGPVWGVIADRAGRDRKSVV